MDKEQWFRGGAFLYGCDYNPDQWLDRPEILARDIEMMKELGINTVNLGIFSWSRLEPTLGDYEFDWLNRILDALEAAQIGYFMATPGAAYPPYLATLYPEVLRMNRDGSRENPVGRNNYCLTSPVLRKNLHLVCENLAREVRYRDGLRGWHLNNELSGECCCPLCAARWRSFLKEKYGSLEALNHAWWSDFSGNRFAAWADIPAPGPGYKVLPGMELDWQRFTTLQQLDYLLTEKLAVTPLTPDKPVTHNSWRIFGNFDWRKFAPELDFMSADVYMQYQQQPGDWMHAGYYALLYSIYRGMQESGHFALMETTASTAFVPPASRQKRPGQLEANVMEAVAHGADLVSFFQWRAGRGGIEQYHGAIIGHDGRCDTRIGRDVAALDRTLQAIKAVRGCRTPAEAVIFYDPENSWLLDVATLPRKGIHLLTEATAEMRAMLACGVLADATADPEMFSRYKLVVAPLCYMLDAGTAARLETFVTAGGTLVLGAFAGWTEEHGLCELGGFPGRLRRLAGVRIEACDAHDDGEIHSVALAMGAAEYPPRNTSRIVFRMKDGSGEFYSRGIAELLHMEGAEPLAEWDDEFFAGSPAVTVHACGKGRVYYVAGLPCDEFRRMLIGKLRDELDLAMGLPGVVPPEGVQIQRRRGESGEWAFLINQSGAARSVPIPEGWGMAAAELPPYGCRVLHR